MTPALGGFLESQFGLLELDKELSGVGMKLPLKRISIGAAVLSALFFFGGLIALFSGKINCALALFALALISLRSPKIVSNAVVKVKRREIENELPFFVSRYSHLISLGITPTGAFFEAAKSGDACSKVAMRAFDLSKKGIPLERAISKISGQVRSEKFESALSAVSSVVSEGYFGSARELFDGIKRGLLEERRSELEKNSAKSQIVFLSVVFTTALVPAIFSFVSAFSAGLAGVAPLFLIAIFPALALAQFAYVRFWLQ